jgi:secreted trypsin-like serine protease
MPLDFAMGPDASNPVETVQVVSILLHPSYRDNNSEHDLAVVTLDRPTDQIPLAILQTPHLAIEGRSLLFVGYGADNGDDASGIGFKRRAEIAVVKVEAETFLSQTESKNSCTGDSGGPAFMRIDERNYRQVGVISRGDKRCLSHGVNTRLDTNSTFLKDLFD